MYQISNFNEFIDLLQHGREIEFKYNNDLYSFNYWGDGSEFTCNDKLIIKCVDRKEFVNKIKEAIIINMPLSQIINSKLYDVNSVYVM